MLLCPWDSPGKNTGVGCHFLLQGIFLTQRLNPGLPHCSQILYHLSQQGSPKVGVTQCISLFLKLTHNPLNLVASQSWFRENEFKDYYAKTLTTKCYLTHKSSFDPINRGYKLPTIIIPRLSSAQPIYCDCRSPIYLSLCAPFYWQAKRTCQSP